jgi:hypothetical protein
VKVALILGYQELLKQAVFGKTSTCGFTKNLHSRVTAMLGLEGVYRGSGTMAQKARILVVEDEAAIRSGLVDVFVYHGYEVKTGSARGAGWAIRPDPARRDVARDRRFRDL